MLSTARPKQPLRFFDVRENAGFNALCEAALLLDCSWGNREPTQTNNPKTTKNCYMMTLVLRFANAVAVTTADGVWLQVALNGGDPQSIDR